MAQSILILGGARSGKSALAERLCAAAAAREGLEQVYLATATASYGGVADPEMTAKIAEHQARRGPLWRTVEAPLALESALRAEASAGRVLLIDCLTLWLTNHMLAAEPRSQEARSGEAQESPAEVAAAAEAAAAARDAALAAALRDAPGRVALVSNEVGLGLVPETRLGRRFRDAQGRLNQIIANAAQEVIFMAAGLPLTLKGDLSSWGD